MQVERNIVLLMYKDSGNGFYLRKMEEIETILLNNKYRVLRYSLSESNAYSRLETVLAPVRKQICLVFSFDAMGFEIPSFGGDRWINTMPCLCITYLAKHPVYFREYLAWEWGWNVVVHCTSDEHRKYINRHYPLLEGVEDHHLKGCLSDELENKPPSINDELSRYIEEIQSLPDVFREMAERIIGYMEKDKDAVIDQVLAQVCKEKSLVLSVEEQEALLEEMLVADRYIKCVRQMRLMNRRKIEMKTKEITIEEYFQYLLALEGEP